MSYGQSLLKRYLDIIQFRYIENYRPDWLEGLELDFYLSGKKTAIEFQGDQHYTFTEFGNPRDQQRRDGRKRLLCKQQGIRLIILDASDLEFTRLRGKGLKNKKVPQSGKDLMEFNRLGKAYRKLLIEKYGSMSARRKHTKIRKASEIQMREKYSIGK